MHLFQCLRQKHKQKQLEQRIQCQQLIDETNAAVDRLYAVFINAPNEYIDLTIAESLLSQQNNLLPRIAHNQILKFKKTELFAVLRQATGRYLSYRNEFINNVQAYNAQLFESRITEAYQKLGDVEGRKMDKQQMCAIMCPAYNNLVIAGAGTGKTTTVIGKIKWLLLNNICAPEEILALSFTNASASEMRQRIQKETGQSVEASTFHKLGLDIIRYVDGTSPKITDVILRKFIKDKFNDLLKSEHYLNLFVSSLLVSRVPIKSEFDFKNEAEYSGYLQTNQPTTLNNETVKSYGEMEIANFLAMNNITYCYEYTYPIDTRTAEYRQYKPDFYLPDYDVYIEYFGINKEGQVPDYYSGKGEKSASQVYQEKMTWKRKLHSEHRTIMIECFAYEKFEEVLLVNLEKHLRENMIRLSPKSPQQILEELARQENTLIRGFIELIETVINLIKSNNDSIGEIRQRILPKTPDARNNHLLLDLTEPIFNAYCKALEQNSEIDFNDMINKATFYIQQGRFRHTFTYVVVDEYQDISKSRYTLLKAMRESRDYSLFCVGDDWQSIYRFAGSDIGFVLNFQHYWGETIINKIETTYRFTDRMIDISGWFIMRNPNQITKVLQGFAKDEGFPLGEILGYNENNLAEFLADKLTDLPYNSTVFFLGRYSFDLDYIKGNPRFICSWDKLNETVTIVFNGRRDLRITFLTVHKSKGLQADYVFILNNKKSRMGFPSKMQDAPLLSLLLDNSDCFPYSEERRLYYIALTRAKKKVILMTLKDNESEFVCELKAVYGEQIHKEAYTCPRCGGHLCIKTGPYGEFFGCSNYHSHECKYTRPIRKKAGQPQ